MEGVQLVVGPSIIACGKASVWWQIPADLLIRWLILVIRLSRNPERGIGFGPTPVTAVRCKTPRRTQTEDRAGIAGNAVVITLGICTQITWITTGILPDHDRIAGTIGDLCDG